MKKLQIKFDFNQFKETVLSLNPKEIYDWPLVFKAAVGFVSFVTVIIIGTIFHLVDVRDEFLDSVQQEEKLKDEFKTKKRQAINLDLYKKQLEEIIQTSDVLLKQLPNKSEIEKLLIDINQAGMSRDLQFEYFKPDAEKMFDFYAELPIKLKVSGNYENIGNFTSDIGNLSRVVIFSDMNIGLTKDGGIYLEALAKTFRYLDTEEIAKQKAEKEKAAKKNKKAPEKEKQSGGH